MAFKKFFFIIISTIINNLLTLDILKKYGSASSPCIFESKDFEVGQDMNFKVTSSTGVGDLHYQYYDDIDSLTIISETKYSVSSPFDETTTVMGIVVSHSRSFTITKKKEEMDGLSGNYILLSSNGNKIENTIIGTNQFIIIIIAVVCGLSGIGIIIIVVYLIKNKCKNKNKEERNNEVVNGVKPDISIDSKGQANPKSGQTTIIYQNKANIVPNENVNYDNSDSKSHSFVEHENLAKNNKKHKTKIK